MAAINGNEGKLSKRKLLAAAFGLPVAFFFAWEFQPKYHGNDDAMTVLVTVFSVLAGFLVAVMAIVANDRALKGRTWRQDTFYLKQVKKELIRHQFLFYLYLWVLALAFLAELELSLPYSMQLWLERIMLFFGCMAMVFSFSLPGQLTRRHISDLEKIIKDKQDQETGKPPS